MHEMRRDDDDDWKTTTVAKVIDPPKASGTRELAQYGARVVIAAQRERKGMTVADDYYLWRQPFGHGAFHRFEGYTANYRAVGFIQYPEAEQLLRELAAGPGADVHLVRLVQRMDSYTSKALRAAKSFHRHIEDTERSVPKVTDGQKTKVYKSEYPLRTHDFHSFEEAQAFIERVVATRQWREMTGRKIDEALVQFQPHRSNATINYARAQWDRRSIKLREKWSWNKVVCLHELAHLLAPRDEEHGPLFCGLLLLLIRLFDSPMVADYLLENYHKNGVKVASDATLRVLFARRAVTGAYATVKSDEVVFTLKPRRRLEKAADRSQ